MTSHLHENLDKIPATESKDWIVWLQTLRGQVKRTWPFAAGIAAALLGVLIYSFPNPAPPRSHRTNV